MSLPLTARWEYDHVSFHHACCMFDLLILLKLKFFSYMTACGNNCLRSSRNMLPLLIDLFSNAPAVGRGLNSSLIIQTYGFMTIKHNCVWISPSEALYLPAMQFSEMRNESWPWCMGCSNLKQGQRNGNFLMLAETLKSGLLFLEFWKKYCSIIIEPKHKWYSLRWLTHKLLLFQRSCNCNLQGKHH
jgi:hypothetical protein